MNSLLGTDDLTVSAEARELREAGVRDYEAEEPGKPDIAAILRKLPVRWCFFLLSMRAHAQQRPGWKPYVRPDEGPPVLTESRLDEEGIYADRHKDGTARRCTFCGGVRWLRMTNRSPVQASIEGETRQPHVYDPGEVYIVPCEMCSRGRMKAYRLSVEQAKKRGGREAAKRERDFSEEES